MVIIDVTVVLACVFIDFVPVFNSVVIGGIGLFCIVKTFTSNRKDLFKAELVEEVLYQTK